MTALDRLIEEDIKVEDTENDIRMDFPTSWDSGVVMDTNTVVQMAEFDEVVESLQRGIPPPPPYPYTSTSTINGPTAVAPTTITVTPAPSPPDRELEHLLNSAPVLRGGGGVMSYHPGGAARLVENRGVAGCMSLPAFTSDQTVPNIVDRVEHTFAVTSRPPSFKQSKATNRTNMRQLLSREQCLEDQLRRTEQLRRAEQIMLEGKEATTGLAISIPASNLNTKQIPTEVFKIETRLENPTKYHVLESQRRQVAEYLSCSPATPSNSSPHTISPNPSHLSPNPSQTSPFPPSHLSPNPSHLSPNPSQASPFPNSQTSPFPPNPTGATHPAHLSHVSPHPGGQLSPNQSYLAASRPSPGYAPLTSATAGGGGTSRRPSSTGGPLSPSCSSSTTSPSEYTPSEVCEDFLDEILSQGGEELLGLGSEVKDEPLAEDELKAVQRDRIKKDNHNMIERRRRYNINDKIKELGTLLPRQNEQYYDLVRDVRHNKGSILKASVDYIKILKREKERKTVAEEEARRAKNENRKLLLKLQEYEQRLCALGLGPDKASWRGATKAELQTITGQPQGNGEIMNEESEKRAGQQKIAVPSQCEDMEYM